MIPHIELYALRPVNKTAGRVVAQADCSDDKPLTKDELVALVGKLERKQRLIKRVLGVRNKVHHKNIMYRIKKGHINPSNYGEPRLLPEYKRVGEAIQTLTRELARLRAERRRVAELEWEAKQSGAPVS